MQHILGWAMSCELTSQISGLDFFSHVKREQADFFFFLLHTRQLMHKTPDFRHLIFLHWCCHFCACYHDNRCYSDYVAMLCSLQSENRWALLSKSSKGIISQLWLFKQSAWPSCLPGITTQMFSPLPSKNISFDKGSITKYTKMNWFIFNCLLMIWTFRHRCGQSESFFFSNNSKRSHGHCLDCLT